MWLSRYVWWTWRPIHFNGVERPTVSCSPNTAASSTSLDAEYTPLRCLNGTSQVYDTVRAVKPTHWATSQLTSYYQEIPNAPPSTRPAMNPSWTYSVCIIRRHRGRDIDTRSLALAPRGTLLITRPEPENLVLSEGADIGLGRTRQLVPPRQCCGAGGWVIARVSRSGSQTAVSRSVSWSRF